jgi:hypothetical protein
LGIAYAVDQSGKTVLKSTYGRYSYLVDEYFARNFSKVNRTVATYTWRDRNGNKKYDFGEVNLDPNGPDFVSITGLASQNPNTFALPHQDEVTASVERELTSTLSVRGLYVFKQSAGEYSIVNVGRPYSSYNVVLTRQDPGPDGTLGNADDGGLVTIWDYDPALRGGSFVRNEVRNRPSNRSDSANNMELAFTKRSQGRWSGSFSFLATKQHRWLVGVPESPNDDVFPLDRTWEISYRTDGQYRLPYGLYASGMFTWMNGQPGQRTYLFRNLPQSSTRTVRLEEYGAQRGPSRTNLNLRVAKTLTLRRQKLDLSIDIFNVFNSNSAWAIGYASGPTFGNTTSIAPPRLASFRAAYKF